MYKKVIALLLLSSMLTVTGCSANANNNENVNNEEHLGEEGKDDEKNSSDIELTSNEAIAQAKDLLWKEYVETLKNDEQRQSEIEKRAMEFGEVTMKYGLQVRGEPDENGYPLYIGLHGGGSSDTPDVNNGQWGHMATYYGKNVKNGVYINPRGVRDTWDTHSNPESFPLYDRLIENMIAFYNVDPNRVYLMGFSAGGDGVYMITPKMTDRFAAANMSAGHPNGINLANIYNMPIVLQVGINDSDYGRNTATAEYDAVLDTLAETYGGGYTHEVYIHSRYGHNFKDNSASEQEVVADVAAWLANGDTTSKMVDTQAVRLMQQYTRNPLPEKLVWEFTNRANQRDVESFYWLRASYDVTEGEVVASYDKETNSITIEKNTANGPITVLINEEMLDVFSPITVNTPDGSSEVTVTPDYEVLKETTYERGDVNYQFVAKIEIK